MRTLPIDKAAPFIPWGVLNTGFDVPADRQDPEDWDGTVPFDAWFEETLRFIADHVWPEFNPETRAWQGESADREKMEKLTRADLDAMSTMQAEKPLAAFPKTTLLTTASPGVEPCPPHQTWFEEEDKTNAFAAKHTLYDNTTTEARRRLMKESYYRDHFAKESNWLSTLFKRRLQRPRPYQMAMALGHSNFTHLHAASADSPSACSGHALQSLCAIGGVIETLILKKVPLTQESLDAIEQYGVDIGDRRVMAGVHYPSDNLISWIILLRFADHVYSVPEVKLRIWEAISQRSIVYRAMKAHAGFKPWIQVLDAEAGSKPTAFSPELAESRA